MKSDAHCPGTRSIAQRMVLEAGTHDLVGPQNNSLEALQKKLYRDIYFWPQIISSRPRADPKVSQIHPGSTPDPSQTHPGWSPERSGMVPRPMRNGPQTDPEWNPDRFEIEPRLIRIGPQTDPKIGPQTDLGWSPDRSQIDPRMENHNIWC